jgi:hypothetical protein
MCFIYNIKFPPLRDTNRRYVKIIHIELPLKLSTWEIKQFVWNMKKINFWEVYRRFRGAYSLHHQGDRSTSETSVKYETTRRNPLRLSPSYVMPWEPEISHSRNYLYVTWSGAQSGGKGWKILLQTPSNSGYHANGRGRRLQDQNVARVEAVDQSPVSRALSDIRAWFIHSLAISSERRNRYTPPTLW